MSRTQFLNIIRLELNWLNRIIDQKILRGQPYRAEAKRHKLLLSKLSNI